MPHVPIAIPEIQRKMVRALRDVMEEVDWLWGRL